MRKLLGLTVIATLFWLTSCKSAYEKQGDEHLNAGRYQKALQRYKYVTKKGNGSEDFNSNLTKAYVGSFNQTVEQGAEIGAILTFREKLNELLAGDVTPEVKTMFGNAIANVVAKLIEEGSVEAEDVAFKLIEDANRINALSGKAKSAVDALKDGYIKKSLSEAEDHYQNCMNGDAQEGIVADYILSKLAIFNIDSEEIQELWSKIRKANLSVYLMYDVEGLITNPDPRINRYGILLGIRSIARNSSSTSIQVQAYNGSSNKMTFEASKFSLEDKAGNVYEPASSRGAFSSKTLIDKNDQSKVGELRFTVGADVELKSLNFKSETGSSVKYLP
ncbi:MAG: hypothetical protein HQK83_18615 [Fibrobacteria bacterium]|nr:hypothetical protein [Fibrobacteria bacterium]